MLRGHGLIRSLTCWEGGGLLKAAQKRHRWTQNSYTIDSLGALASYAQNQFADVRANDYNIRKRALNHCEAKASSSARCGAGTCRGVGVERGADMQWLEVR